MLGMLNSLTKAVVGVVVEAPIAIVSDIATLGGSLNDRQETYTETALRNVTKNISDSTKP